MREELRNSIDRIRRASGNSIQDKALVDTFRGLSVQGGNTQAPINQESQGYVFFTKPALNLAKRNIMNDPVLSMLLTNSSDSMPRAVRCYLDHTVGASEGIPSSVVDDHLPFIPVLSNNLVSLTGYRDYTNQTSSTAAGVYRETMHVVDDVPYDYEPYSLTANFRNISGDVMTYLPYIWCYYAASARIGNIIPYPEFLFYRELDYTTAIFRFTMDKTRRYITGMHKTGAAIPINAPIGEKFDYTAYGNNNPDINADKQISINFQCVGSTVYNPLIAYEFNTLVMQWNRHMRDTERSREMVKLELGERPYFNYHCYPLINFNTMELEWYANANEYAQYKKERAYV